MHLESVRVAVASACVVFSLAACSDPNHPVQPVLRVGTIVLNGVLEPGVTVVADSDGETLHLSFGSAFDGDRLTVHGDTMLATSSAFSGDQLYVASLATRTLLRVQLPAASNPATVAVVPAGALGAEGGRYLIPLRNTGQLAQVNLAASAGDTVRTIPGVGRCPWDVVVHGGVAWVVDANQQCADLFQVVGASRLIRAPLVGAERDTVELGSHAISATRLFVLGDFAYVFAGGCTPYSSGCTLAPASLTKVSLATRSVTGSVTLPAGVYGVSMTLGRDGRLYLTGSRELFGDSFAPRVYVMDPASLTFVGATSAADPSRDLFRSPGVPAKCYTATGDAVGRIHCVENGQTLARLLVFSEAGQLERDVAAGSLAFDVTVR
jgi:hypothetical protein